MWFASKVASDAPASCTTSKRNRTTFKNRGGSSSSFARRSAPFRLSSTICKTLIRLTRTSAVSLIQCTFRELGHPRRLDERHSERRAVGDGQHLKRPACDTQERRHVDGDMLLVIERDGEAIPSGILFAGSDGPLVHRLSSKRR